MENSKQPNQIAVFSRRRAFDDGAFRLVIFFRAEKPD